MAHQRAIIRAGTTFAIAALFAACGTVAGVLTQLFLVRSAVQQLKSGDAQSCGNKIGDGVVSRATITWAEAIDGTGLWVLDCG